MKKLLILTFLFATFVAISQAFENKNGRHVPTIDELLQIETIGAVQISPNGKWVAYTMSGTDFEQDAFISQIWLVDAETGESFQLTRGEKPASNPQWSPDGQWLAFTSSREGDKNQIFVIRPIGGEATRLTDVENGVGGFEWSQDGKTIAFLATDTEAKEMKARKDHVGPYDVVRKEYQFRHIWTFDVAEALKKPQKGTQRTMGKDFNVNSFSWSPNNKRIAFSATINPDFINFGTSDVYMLDVASDSSWKLVSQPGPDSNPQWSPDGKQILFSTQMGREKFFAYNSNLAIIPASGGEIKVLTEAFDENPGFVKWNADGIYFQGMQKTASHLFRLDPATLKFNRVTQPDNLISSSFSLTNAGKKLAFAASSPTTLREIYISDPKNLSPKKLTSTTDQVQNFILGSRELISWKSKDGTEIEGVLIKPGDFDPSKKYPLLCAIHGGPTGIDRPDLLSDGRFYYPLDIWVERGALVLLVNYRGSAGYGEKFRTLNMRNLGVGDAWDVISGVDHLIEKGWVDPKKVGCMGWSQGGYISAFLTTSSDRFAAISVGAGISNWATYYYNTDITPFTINYLGDDPVDDPAIYEKTSPMSYIKNAKTPTLIQHGEDDRRVPIPNAYELRQGLEDRGVPVEMVVYKGFGHGISKPKSQRAVMWHNLAWFNHYLFGDPLPDLTKPDVPEKEDEEEKEKSK